MTTFAKFYWEHIMQHIDTTKLRAYVLPVAIVLGILLHKWCAVFKVILPYLIFSMLLLNFVAVDIRKLRFTKIDVWLLLFQIILSLISYLLANWLYPDATLAQGLMIGILCPVAAACVVIACMLGANRETVTAYTIYCNLMVCIIAPIYFSFIGIQQDMPFLKSFLLIFKKTSLVIALPFLIALLLQIFTPKTNNWLSKYKGYTFYIWSVTLFLTLGQTIDFIFLHGKGNLHIIIALGIASIITCAVQFWLGRLIGKRFGDAIAGGQLLAQKNTAMGIWMATIYLNPLASVFLAFYSVWQNIFNSWQIWNLNSKNQHS